MTSTATGYVIIAHDVLGNISDREILEALEDRSHQPYHIVRISPTKIKHGDAKQHHWPSLIKEQERLFNEKVKPLIDEYRDYQVLYFGLAPIPLAIHLGYMVRSFTKAEVFLKDHAQKDWKWRDLVIGSPEFSGLPTDTFQGSGDVVVRIGTRFKIEPKQTLHAANNLLKEVDIYPPKLGPDLFGSHESVAGYAQAFTQTIDAISSHLPNAQNVHLFAAVPVGLAFLIGQEIMPTAHTKVHVYEYAKDQTPPYIHAFIVNDDEQAVDWDITPEDRARFKELRKEFSESLDYVKEDFIGKMAEETEDHWFKALAPSQQETHALFDNEYWNYLKPIHETELRYSFIEENHKHETDQFYRSGFYHFSDQFLKALHNGISQKDELLSAFRLFCFHETIHHSTHSLQSENAEGISRYPKALEEADYQADVYALLHEFFYERIPLDEVCDFFTKRIQLLTETMWAFDKQKTRSDSMEVHRVNRYLIWYYQLCRIESTQCQSLLDVCKILSVKPLIELKLLGVRPGRDQKIVFDFKNISAVDLGICVFHEGRIRTHGNELGDFPITDLIKGFQNHQPAAIQKVLRALLAKI